MRKIIFWIGVAVFLLSILCGFLAGSTSGPDLKPTLPIVYGTNQLMWLGLALLGLIVLIV
jgi:hypothetical protein